MNTTFNHKSNKNGFTLAELLITLSIIGVVAVLTIPNLIAKYNENQLKTRWKKEYGNGGYVVKRLYIKNGTVEFTNSEEMRNDFGIFMPFIKTGTWDSLSGLEYNYYDNSGASNDTSGWTEAAGQLMDGSIWRFNPVSIDCTGTVGGTLNNICAEITVDVNGTKEPNEYGKDLHFIHLVRNNGNYIVYPYGSMDDGQTCGSPGIDENTSRGCSSKVLKQ